MIDKVFTPRQSRNLQSPKHNDKLRNLSLAGKMSSACTGTQLLNIFNNLIALALFNDIYMLQLFNK